MAAKVYLLRHGVTDWNAGRRAQGHADIPLNAAGRRQARKAAARLVGVPLAAVYSSDLSRAIETARPIATERGLEVLIRPGFKEIDQGDWEGLTGAEIRARWPDLWGPARPYAPRPGGESPEQVRTRALAALSAAVSNSPEGDIVIASHGGTIRWVVAAALGLDIKESGRVRGLSNGGMVVLTVEDAHGSLEFGPVERLDGASPSADDPNQ